MGRQDTYTDGHSLHQCMKTPDPLALGLYPGQIPVVLITGTFHYVLYGYSGTYLISYTGLLAPEGQGLVRFYLYALPPTPWILSTLGGFWLAGWLAAWISEHRHSSEIL